MRGPVIGQGITPASDDGQIQTLDEGGVVQAQTLRPEVSGGAAGFSSGLASGQVMGQNIVNAWHNRQARDAAEEQGIDAAGIDAATSGVPSTAQPSLGLQFDNAVSHFMHHLSGSLQDEPGTPRGAGPDGSLSHDATHDPVTNGPSQYGSQTQPASGIPATPGAAGPPTAAAGTAPTAPVGAAPSPPGAVPSPPGAAPPSAGTAPPGPLTPFVPGQAPPPGAAPTAANAAGATAQAGTTPDIVKASAQGRQDEATDAPVSRTSLTADWWEHSEKLKQQAMMHAYKMGKDPAQVGASMDAIRTGAFQAQMTRHLSAAQAAEQAGDDVGLKKNLQAMYDYLPDGKGLVIKTATQSDVDANQPKNADGTPNQHFDPSIHVGALMFKTPFAGLPGHENDPAYTPINSQSIARIGQTLMDPQNVNKAQLEMFSAVTKARSEMLTAQGAEERGRGILGQGTAAQQKAAIAAIMAPHQADLDTARGHLFESEAAKNNRWVQQSKNGPSVTMGSVNTAMAAAAKASQDQAQGPLEAQPATILNPTTGKMMNNPNAGMPPSRNAAKVSPAYQGLTTEQRTWAAGKAQAIAGSNVGTVGSEEAADSAARIAKAKADPKAFTHMNANKEEEPDYVEDPEHGKEYLWVRTPKPNGLGYRGGAWKEYRVSTPNISDSEPAPTAASGSGGNSGESQPEAESATVDATDH